MLKFKIFLTFLIKYLDRKTVIIDKSKRTNALLEKLDLFTKGTPPQNWSPSRFLYKVGVLQLKNITPELITIAKNETKLLKKDAFRYSLIWALGRCGDERVLPLLDTLVKTDEKEYIKRLTLEVYLKLAATSAKAELLKNIKDLIPVDALHTLMNSEVTSLCHTSFLLLSHKCGKNRIAPCGIRMFKKHSFSISLFSVDSLHF